MKAHPVAEAFPLPDEDHIKDLARSIRTTGQIVPVVCLGNQVLDGRCRMAACKLIHIQPRIIQYKGKKDIKSLVAFVDGANDKRRHMTVSQRAAVAVELTKIANPQQKQPVIQAENGKSANLHFLENSNIGPKVTITQAEAAEQMGVSKRTVATLAKVKKQRPAAFEKVKAGEITVNAAAAGMAPKPQPAKAKPPVSGQIKKSTHPIWNQWDKAFGKLKLATSAVNKTFPNNKLFTEINDLLNDAFDVKERWRP